MSLREQIVAEFKADHNGEEPTGSFVRMIERHRVSELDPASAEAQRIRGDIDERNAVSTEAVRRWFALLHQGLPIPMPSVSVFELEVRQERAAAR